MDFPRQDVLQDHYVKMHTVPKPYVCGHCDKRFEKKENLEQHVRIHTGERPYKCNVCDRSFRQSSNLAQHKRIHNRKGLKRRSSELPSSDAEGGPAQFRRREIKIEPTPGLLQSRVLVNRQGAGQMGNSARVSPWANHMNHIPASPGQEAQHSTSVTSSESYINQVFNNSRAPIGYTNVNSTAPPPPTSFPVIPHHHLQNPPLERLDRYVHPTGQIWSGFERDYKNVRPGGMGGGHDVFTERNEHHSRSFTENSSMSSLLLNSGRSVFSDPVAKGYGTAGDSPSHRDGYGSSGYGGSGT
ncbi:hypothetical protein AAMO2058_001569200 [Amorphochlora amoebiformis]